MKPYWGSHESGSLQKLVQKVTQLLILVGVTIELAGKTVDERGHSSIRVVL